jgi:N-methylhydantoinase B
VQAAEIVEMQCPVRVEHYGIREGSCGDGMFRGGCGMRRDIRILADEASLSVLADHAIIPPFGVAGGLSGARNSFVVLRDGEIIQPSPIAGKVGGFKLRKGDIVRIESSGGGGYGDPLDREPARVAHDVNLGYLSVDDALKRYGVAFASPGEVDVPATSAARVRLRNARLRLTIDPDDTDTYDGARRRIELPRVIADHLGLSEGDLLELAIATSGSALRGWARIVEGAEKVSLGPTGRAVLGVKAGDMVEVRAIRSPT